MRPCWGASKGGEEESSEGEEGGGGWRWPLTGVVGWQHSKGGRLEAQPYKQRPDPELLYVAVHTRDAV